ncbi:MAG TPA: thioredoxin family protein [Thermoanaerobaculia bacterium]|nr:thioredoxin family protein [Thermoanaerobaculia bacterium]
MKYPAASFEGAVGGASPGAISLTLVVLALAGVAAHRVWAPASPSAAPPATVSSAPVDAPTSPPAAPPSTAASAPVDPPAPAAPSAELTLRPAPAMSHEEASAPVRSRDLWYEGADGYRQAVSEATSDHRAMAVYFRTDWCPYCKKLDRGLLSDSAVQSYLQTVVKVRINPEKGSAERQLERDFGGTAYPYFLIVPPGRRLGERVEGVTRAIDGRWRQRTPSEFIAECRRAAG